MSSPKMGNPLYHLLRGVSTMAKSPAVREEEGDLFRAPHMTSLAHCVSSDMKMGAGIAVFFRQKFGRVEDLKNQNKSVGEVAYLKDGPRYIFYLVTKKWFFDKPTESTLQSSLLEMKEMCKVLGVTKLAMPRIGCGLDGLKWPSVFHMVKEIFSDCGMEITIYSIPDRRPKFMTPTLSRNQEDIRDFFKRRPHSLPQREMPSKRKMNWDSSDEDYNTPKRSKRDSESNAHSSRSFRDYNREKETPQNNFRFQARNSTGRSDNGRPMLKSSSSPSVHRSSPLQSEEFLLSNKTRSKDEIPFLSDCKEVQSKASSSGSRQKTPVPFDSRNLTYVKKRQLELTDEDSFSAASDKEASTKSRVFSRSGGRSEDPNKIKERESLKGSERKSRRSLEARRSKERESSRSKEKKSRSASKSKERKSRDSSKGAEKKSRESSKSAERKSRNSSQGEERKSRDSSKGAERRSRDSSSGKERRSSSFSGSAEKKNRDASRSKERKFLNSSRNNDLDSDDSAESESFSTYRGREEESPNPIIKYENDSDESIEEPDFPQKLSTKVKYRLGAFVDESSFKGSNEAADKSSKHQAGYPSLIISKKGKKISKQMSSGTMYSDRPNDNSNVKARLSLGPRP